MTTKEKIFKTAIKSFSEKGFEGVRIDQLIQDAGFNKATFYYHFKSKQEIFEHVIIESFNTALEKLDFKISICETVQQKLESFIDVMFSREREDVVLIIREILNGADHLSDELLLVMTGIMTRLKNILKEGKDDGIFIHDDITLIMPLIIGMSDFFILRKPFGQRLEVLKNQKEILNVDNDIEQIVQKMKKLIFNHLQNPELS
jgi:TetR/AcrR family transcriptional regulator